MEGGFAAFAVDKGFIYALHRMSGKDVLSGLRLENGMATWGRSYPIPTDGRTVADLPRGAGVTALPVSGRLITIGPSENLYGFAENSPGVAWARDLIRDYRCEVPEFGYSASLVGYQNSVIALIGGPDHGVVAFGATDGLVLWETGPYDISYAAPILIDVGGQSQVVFLSSTDVVALDPNDGSLLWGRPHKSLSMGRQATLLATEGGLLLVSSYGGAGTRMLQLTSTGNRAKIEELWHHEKLYIYPPSALRVGDYIYASTGDQPPVSLLAIHAKTGKTAWREAGFLNAQSHYFDGRIVLFDENGLLTVVTPAPEKLIVDSQVKAFEKGAWWNSTRIDHRLLIRDKDELLVYDLTGGTR